MNPDTAMWINIGVTICASLTGMASTFTDLFGEGPAKKIVAAVSLAGVVFGAVNAALHASSTAQPGPLAPPPADKK